MLIVLIFELSNTMFMWEIFWACMRQKSLPKVNGISTVSLAVTLYFLADVTAFTLGKFFKACWLY